MADDPEPAQTPEQIAKHWQMQLELGEKSGHKEWIEAGRKVYQRYKSERKKATSGGKKLNILYSNTEVIRAALYGRQAKPDVRRRFKNGDPAGQTAAEIIEAALVYCNETYDMDRPIELAVQDYALPGRGVVRVDYEPVIKQREVIDPLTAQPMMGEDNKPVMEEFIAEQVLRECYVFWEDFLTSPARNWEGVSKNGWISFRHTMDREELRTDLYGKVPETSKTFGSADDVPLNWMPDVVDRKDPKEELKKAEVFEIWDISKRERIWQVKGHPMPCRIDQDPYGLEDFYPLPEPPSSYCTTDTLIPEPEFHAYQDQADDLDEITARISRLTKALKRRGVYDQSVKELARLANASDNQFIAVENYSALTTKGGLAAAFQTEDISIIAKVLLELYQQRDMLIQSIYEVTGISDILRGTVDPDEKLGQSELKAQFGSQRMKRRQRAIQRWIRDILKIKAEIIAEHFEPQVLQEMTGQEITQEVMQILRTDKLRSYRIDIETDSTIFEDAAQEKQSRVELVTAISAFMKEWGPIVTAQPAMLPLAFELLKFAVSGFKASRQLEDSIEQTQQTLTQMAQQAAQQGQRDPEAEAKAKESEAKLQGIQAQTQAKVVGAQVDIQKSQQQLAIDQERNQMEREQMAFKAAMPQQPEGRPN